MTPASAHALEILFVGLFAGATMMEMIVEHPARLSADIDTAAHQMRGVLARADPLMPFLATGGAAAGITAFVLARHWSDLVAGGMVGLNILFTLVVVLPLNRRLLAFEAHGQPREFERDMRHWQNAHRVRACSALAAFLLLVFAPLA